MSSTSRQPVRSELQGTSISSVSSREPTEAVMDLQRAKSVSARSEDSAAIDQVPHRPPPMHDFEAYNDYVAGLSDQEYFEMFNCPFPGGTPASMSGSDVDSNERYVRDYTHEEDPFDLPSRTNSNNTVGSREGVWNQLQHTAQRMRYEGISIGVLVEEEAGSRARWSQLGSDEPLGEGRELSNNMWNVASSSSSQVVIPARKPTRRIPPLETQQAF